MSPNTRLADDILSLACSMGLTSVNLTQLALKDDVMCEVTRNDGHCAVQGHSRSPILVNTESSYATFPHRFRVIAPYWSNYSFWRRCYYL